MRPEWSWGLEGREKFPERPIRQKLLSAYRAHMEHHAAGHSTVLGEKGEPLVQGLGRAGEHAESRKRSFVRLAPTSWIQPSWGTGDRGAISNLPDSKCNQCFTPKCLSIAGDCDCGEPVSSA